MQLTVAAILAALFLAVVQWVSVNHISMEALVLFVATAVLASLFSKNTCKTSPSVTLSFLFQLASAYSL